MTNKNQKLLAKYNISMAKQCTALAIVIPEDVKTAYTEKSKSFKHMNAGMRNTGFSNETYNDGFVTGKGAMTQRAIEA